MSYFSAVLRVASLCASLLCLSFAPAHAQNPSDGYSPGANSTVWALAMQPDGRVVVAGAYNDNNVRLARLLADGSFDLLFAIAGNTVIGTVNAVALQADGKIVIGGSFSQVGSFTRHNLARLSGDGSVDSDFNPDVTGEIDALAVQADGAIVLGGSFSAVGVTPRTALARIDIDGNLDSSLTAAPSGSVFALAVQGDGKLLVGGFFDTIDGADHSFLARFNSDGGIDAAFNPGVNNTVYALAFQPDGKLIIGGAFTGVGAATRNAIARINRADGLDPDFDPDVSGPGFFNAVSAIAVQADGKVVLGGTFGTVGGTVRHNIARLQINGALDASFNLSVDSTVDALAIQPDGKVVVGGQFTSIPGTTLQYMVRLNADGSLDATIDPDVTGFVGSTNVQALAVQGDGKVVLSGFFTAIGGTPRSGIARLNVDNSLDAVFHPVFEFGEGPAVLQAQPDGKLLLGGLFTTIDGTPRFHLARLNADGGLDPDFNPDVEGADVPLDPRDVVALALQTDGKVVLGGLFDTVGGIPRTNIARVNANGSLDVGFDPAPDKSVNALAMQSDGKVVVGGNFNEIDNVPRSGIARLDVNGNVDPDFNPNSAGGGVAALAVQPDGKIILGGLFSTINGLPHKNIARVWPNGTVDSDFTTSVDNLVTAIVVQSDGKIIVGGLFHNIGVVPRDRIARLNANGTLDTDFDASAGDYVFALALQADGKLWVGGQFDTIGGATRHKIARLSQPDAALQSLMSGGGPLAPLQSRAGAGFAASNRPLASLSTTTITWMRSGTSPELALPPELSYSVDGDVYDPVGTMSPIDGGWSYDGLTLPAIGQTYYLRARGQLPSGQIESVRQAYVERPADTIYADGFE